MFPNKKHSVCTQSSAVSRAFPLKSSRIASWNPTFLWKSMRILNKNSPSSAIRSKPANFLQFFAPLRSFLDSSSTISGKKRLKSLKSSTKRGLQCTVSLQKTRFFETCENFSRSKDCDAKLKLKKLATVQGKGNASNCSFP